MLAAIERPPGHQHSLNDSALLLFERINELMGMSEWPCQLEQISDPNARKMGFREGIVSEWRSMTPAGLFMRDETNQVVISHNEQQLTRPAQLTATLVHELCHYLLQTRARSHPPTG
jgi:predicted SprT family Zn-dependent metalloprotease